MNENKRKVVLLPSAQTCLKWPLQEGVIFANELHNIEKHWKDKIKNKKPKGPDSSQKTKYILPMFPYPSGKLHLGHLRVYTISDVLSRYYTLKGYNVIHPIGWDAFGLPAENAAIERGIDPETWTYSNIDLMRKQLQKPVFNLIGTGYEIFTCKPDYFKWTQWIFLQLYKHGYVRRTMAEVFWDPVDKTVLAAEQVDKEGRAWRSGAMVEKQLRCQWAIETPKLAKRMMRGLETVKNDWKEVASIQESWIGKCDVFRFLLPIKGKEVSKHEQLFDLRLKDPSDLLSTTFIVVTPKHALAEKNSMLQKDYLVDGVHVFNFLTGLNMPVVVSHEEKDCKDAEYFLNARIGRPDTSNNDAKIAKSFNLNVELVKISMTVEEIQAKAKEGNYGGYATSRNLLDWIVSRQRSWGTPIPMVLDEEGKSAMPIAESQLPLLSESRSQRVAHDGFPSGFGIVEADTLDTFFDSSWYFLRYLDPSNSKDLVDKKIVAEQMPVDVYVGGVEHADVHLFFARFISYFLYDLGILKSPEPVKKLISQGYVLGKTFSLESTGAFLENKDVEETKDLATNICTYVQKSTGSPVAMSYAKMSKSKRNGVDPLEVIERDGVDLARLQLLDSAAPQQPLQWGFTQESDMRGIKRFLFRLARLVGIYVEERTKLGNTFDPLPAEEEEIYKDHFNNYVKALSMNLEILCVHNAAFEQLQGLIKYLQKAEPNTVGRSSEIERCIHAMVIMLQVFAPHAAAELWAALSNAPKIQNHLWNSSAHVSFQDWPKTDKDCIIDVLLHINGELMASRARRNVIEPLSAEETIAFAKQSAHATFFDLLCEAGLQVKEIEVVKNYGLDVHLHLTMEDDVSKESVLNVLKQIWKAKILSRKESKKVKKLKSVV